MGVRDRQDGIVNKNLQVKDKEILFFQRRMYPPHLFIIYRRLLALFFMIGFFNLNSVFFDSKINTLICCKTYTHMHNTQYIQLLMWNSVSLTIPCSLCRTVCSTSKLPKDTH